MLQRIDAMTPSDFVPFESKGLLFLEERLRAIPAGSTIKGMFFHPLIEEARRVWPEAFAGRLYSALTNYPASEFLLLAAEAAALVHPELPPREALRRLGRLHQNAFTQRSVGRVLMSFAGGYLETALGLIPRIYELLAPGMTATIQELNSFSAVISLRHCWGFPECYQVGVFEGVFEAFQVEGDVWVKPLSFSEVDLALFWRRKRR